jgi:hypothetical protein
VDSGSIGVARFSKIAEEVEHSFGDPHVLFTKVLREEWHSSDQGHPQYVRNIFTPDASQPLKTKIN